MKWIDDVMASQWRTHERDPRYRDAENNPTRLVWPGAGDRPVACR